MSRLVNYSSRQVQVAWGGVPFTGFADDSIVTIAYNSDQTTEKVGADGISSVSITPDRSGLVTINLMQGSTTHILLSRVMQDQDLTGTLKVADFSITSPDGVTYIATGAHIKTAPEVMKNVESEAYTYVFYSDEIRATGAPLGLGPIDGLNSVVESQLQLLNNASAAILNTLT